MERIADGQPPLIFGDGLQTMDFVYTDRHRPGQRAGGGRATSPRASTTSPAATETSLLELAEALLRGHGLRPRPSSTARSAPSTASPAGWPTPRPPQRDLGFAAAGRPRRRPARARRLVAAAARRDRRAAGAARWRVDEPHQRHAALARRRGGRGGRRGHRAPAGSPRVRGWPRFEAAFADARCRPTTPSPSRQLHDRRCTWRWSWPASARATTWWCRRSRSSPPPTPSTLRRRAPGLRRRRRRRPATSPPTTVERGAHRRAPARSSSSTRAGCPVDLDAIRALCDPRGIVGRRGRRLRRRLDLPRPPGRRRRRDRRLVVPPAQDPHHRRGRHDHHRRRADWAGPGPAAARARDERLGRRPARAACWRRPRSTSRSASTSG